MAAADETVCLRLRDDSDDSRDSRDEGGVVRRFRDNFHTLSHLARDPLVWNADEGAFLADLRDTLTLTESALAQFESTASRPSRRAVAVPGILSIARVVQERVDQLFDRMERLSALRQRALRLSATFEIVHVGVTPLLDQIEPIAQEIIAAAADGQPITLVHAEAADQVTQVAAHAVNVAELVARMALAVPAWREEIMLAVVAALLQDLGMLQVPAEIFHSTEPLTAPQRVLVQQHPATSASIVERLRGRDERLVAAVYQHHERLDGSGYPERATDKVISPVARLLGVADVYVGMQSRRPYRKALGADQAWREVELAATEGRLDLAWAERLPSQTPHWLTISTQPNNPSGASAVSALAA